MGEESRTYTANDNGDEKNRGLDDRMGFKSFLRETESFNMNPPLAPINTAHTDEALQDLNWIGTDEYYAHNPQDAPAQIRPVSTAWNVLTHLGGLIALAVIALAALFVFKSVNPAERSLGLAIIIIAALFMAGMAARRHAGHIKAVSILIALAAALGVLVTLAQGFAVTALSLSNSGFWITAAGLSLVTAALLHSRIALVLSITATALWGYALYTGTVSLGFGLLALPVLAVLQMITSHHLRDNLSRAAAQIMIFSWGLSALYFASIDGMATPPLIISALTLLTGLVYLASAHPFRIWKYSPDFGTAMISWLALMMCSLATVWLWMFPDTLGRSDAVLSPLTEFIWQLGLIGGIGALFAAALLRRALTSHSFPRRLAGAALISALAASHYILKDIPALTQSYSVSALQLYSALVVLGGLLTLTLSKFASGLRYGHAGWMVASSLMATAVVITLGSLPNWNIDLIAIFGVSAFLTVLGLSWTHKRSRASRQAQAVYRPLKQNAKARNARKRNKVKSRTETRLAAAPNNTPPKRRAMTRPNPVYRPRPQATS